MQTDKNQNVIYADARCILRAWICHSTNTSITLISRTNNAYCLIIPWQIRFPRVLIKFISLQLKDIDFTARYVFVCKHILKWVLIQKSRQAVPRRSEIKCPALYCSLFPQRRPLLAWPASVYTFASNIRPGAALHTISRWLNQSGADNGLNERVKSFSTQHPPSCSISETWRPRYYIFERRQTSWESMMVDKKDESLIERRRARILLVSGPFQILVTLRGVQVQVLRRPTRGTANGPITAEIFSADFFAQFQHGYVG